MPGRKKARAVGWPGGRAEVVPGERGQGSLPSRAWFTGIVQGLSWASLPNPPGHAEEQEL